MVNFPVKIYRYILNVLFLGCTEQLEVEYQVDWAPEIKAEVDGTYRIQTGTFGGRDWYLSSNGRSAIWYNDGHWRAGSARDKGTDRCSLEIPSDVQCPHQTWSYFEDNLWYPPVFYHYYDEFYNGLRIFKKGSSEDWTGFGN